MVLIPPEGFKSHPVADVLPMIPDEEIRELAEDIKKNGLQERIVLCDGMILDGRNRYQALQLLGKHEIPNLFNDMTEVFSVNPGRIVPFVLSRNLHRRHLNTSQRASVAADLKEIEAERAKERQAAAGRSHGRGQKHVQNLSQPIGQGKARDIAAKQLNVSGPLVDMAETVRNNGTPELQAAVREGKAAVSSAAAIAKAEPEVQRQAVAGGKKGVATAAKSRRLSDDELFEQSVKLARAEGHASAAMLKNKFVIGLGRAEKMIDRLQRENIIDPDTSQVIEQPTVIRHNFDPHDDLEEILDVYAGEIPDSQVPLYVDLLWAIAANPNVEAIQNVARRLSED